MLIWYCISYFITKLEKLPPYGPLFSSSCGGLQTSAANSGILWAPPFFREIFCQKNFVQEIFFLENFFSGKFFSGHFFSSGNFFFWKFFFWQFFSGKFISGKKFLQEIFFRNIFSGTFFLGNFFLEHFLGGVSHIQKKTMNKSESQRQTNLTLEWGKNLT